eukprot:TRINITY_DN87792_c0_g1_i1.p1 TRINITY_DN87792_c0_g1~~TRINITY_DN87792_c0_g1_i1.p1  ORF type:complete len:497 (+),score=65.37 TRINITY_DN87792_c0_g1_i1:66-1493(+)
MAAVHGHFVLFLRLALCAPLLRPEQPALDVEARALANTPYNNCNGASGSTVPQPAFHQLPTWSGSPEDFFEDYRQLHHIDAYIDHLHSTHPDVVTLKKIGTSTQGRIIRAIELTNEAGDIKPADKPCIVLMGGIHAREWISPATMVFLAQAVAGNNSNSVRKLLDHFVVTVMPSTNPDGYNYAWTTNRMWRKTRSNAVRCQNRPTDIAGVDPNRNWDYMWGVSKDDNYRRELQNPCTDVYAGPHAFSEPEVRAVADYMELRQNRSWSLSHLDNEGKILVGPGYVAAFIDYHAYAQMLLPPWSHRSGTPAAPDSDYQTGMTGAIVKAIKAASGRTFQAGADLFPSDPGTAPDWAYGRLGVRATMTVELEGSYYDPSGFCLPRTMIKDVGEEQFRALLALGDYLLEEGATPSSLIGSHARERWNELNESKARWNDFVPANTSTSMESNPASNVSVSRRAASSVLHYICLLCFLAGCV